jgi:hypothetical protein
MDLAPAARTALRTLVVGTWRGLAWSTRTAWTHRRVLNAIVLRAAWWAALWLAIETASSLVDVSAPLDIEGMLTRFAVGLGMCWAVVVFSGSGYLRWAGIALGTVHGVLGLLLWTVTGGT